MAKKKNGRPTEYKGEETDKRAFKLALLGLTDEEIADNLDICPATLYNWKDKDHASFQPSFLEMLMKAKDEADAEVFACMRQRAMGYTKTIDIEHPDGTKTREVKYYPPDVPAQKAWLANRRKMKFNADINHIISTEANDLDEETEAEIKKRIKKLIK